jgi:hypothetical protein
MSPLAACTDERVVEPPGRGLAAARRRDQVSATPYGGSCIRDQPAARRGTSSRDRTRPRSSPDSCDSRTVNALAWSINHRKTGFVAITAWEYEERALEVREADAVDFRNG